MGASKDPAGGSNVEIYLRLKPTPKASPLVTLDTVRPVVIREGSSGPPRLVRRETAGRTASGETRTRYRYAVAVQYVKYPVSGK